MSRAHAGVARRAGAAVLLGLVCACAQAPPPPAAPASDFSVPVVDLRSLPEPSRAAALEAQRAALDAPGNPEAVGRLGLHYYTYEFYLASARCLARASELDPRSFKWAYYLALAQDKSGDVGAAAATLERALEIDPRYGPAYVLLGDLRIEKDPARAEGLYRKAHELNPDDPRAHLGLGRCARRAGRNDRAMEEFEEALRTAPDYADAHYAVAMLLSAGGRKQEAAEHLRLHAAGHGPPHTGDPLLRELASLGKDSSYGLVEDAKRLMDEGRLEEAESLLRRAVATDVSGSVARTQLGAVLGLQRRYAEAATELQIVLEADPSDPVARANLGRAFEGMGRKADAEREYRSALKEHPDNAEAHLYLGQLLSAQGSGEEAIDQLRRAAALQPSNGEARYHLGVALAQSGKMDEAIEHLRGATRLMPGHVGAWYTLGQVLLMGGDADGAEQAWRETVRVSPGFANGHAGIARAALRRGDAEAAVRSAERACELGRYMVREHVELLADAYDAAGRTEEAAAARRRIPAAR